MSLIHKSTEPPPTDWLGASVREKQRARSNEETSWMRKFLRYYYFIIIAWNYCSGTAKDSHVLNCIAVDCTLWWWLPLLRSVRLLCAKWALVLFVLRLHCRRRSAFEFRKLNLHSERARAFKNITHPPTTRSESAAVIGEGEKMSEREEGNISGIIILVSQRERQREPGKWHCHYRIFNMYRERVEGHERVLLLVWMSSCARYEEGLFLYICPEEFLLSYMLWRKSKLRE